jgi:hypothetical protein
MTTTLTITALLTGAVLGQRLNVLILFPIIFIGLISIPLFSLLDHDSLSSTLLRIAFVITALQLGYFGGTITRVIVAATRIRRVSAGAASLTQQPIIK